MSLERNVIADPITGAVVWPLGVFATAGPSFSAYASTNQTILTGAWTTVSLDTKEYDTGTNFSTSTNAFTPPIAGKYHFTGGIQSVTNLPSSNLLQMRIYKNSTAWKVLSLIYGAGAFVTLNGGCDIIDDGTGNAYTLQVNQNTGSNFTLQGLQPCVYFSGFFIRG